MVLPCLVPKDISFSDVSTNSAFVSIVPPDGNPEIEQYQARVKDGSASQTCNVNANAEPLGCHIEHLLPAREFTIEVSGCLPISVGCGIFKEKSLWAMPNGNTLNCVVYHKLNMNLIALHFTAPASVIVTPVSTSVVSVAIAASLDSPGVTIYRASVGTKTCNAPVAGGAPFTCAIGTLSGGKLHTVQVVACLATGDCSTETLGHGYTFPDGRLVSLR